MIISQIFKNSGVPVSGLSPTISIWELEAGRQVVTNAAMSEIGQSCIYKYFFSGYSATKTYHYKLDGTATITGATERYIDGRLESHADEYYRQRDWARKLER